MQLTEHFTLAELVASAKARELGIDNTPTPEAVARLRATAEVLERIRATLGGVHAQLSASFGELSRRTLIGMLEGPTPHGFCSPDNWGGQGGFGARPPISRARAGTSISLN